MPERILFLPSWPISPHVCEEIPGIRTALADFVTHLPVEVFCWPWFKGGKGADVSWRDQVAAIEASVHDDCHVVVMGTGVATALLAASSPKRPRSFIAAGMVTPLATLQALGETALADILMLGWEGRTTYQYVRLIMEGAAEEEWDRYARMMDQEIDWTLFTSAIESWPSLNLVQDKPELLCPGLYLDSPLPVAGYAEQREAFLKIVPGAEVQELDVWPGRMHEKASGRDLSQKALAFIQGLAGA
jgi:hypothetical protein